LENSNECLTCFVDAFLKNPHLTKQMDNESLLTKIIGDKFKNQWLDKGLIEFPIFFKVTCDDKIRVKQSYELFLRVKKCEKPSQLMLLDNNFNEQKFIFFLRYVCVPETMQLSR